jgi:hypothetical protein
LINNSDKRLAVLEKAHAINMACSGAPPRAQAAAEFLLPIHYPPAYRRSQNKKDLLQAPATTYK